MPSSTYDKAVSSRFWDDFPFLNPGYADTNSGGSPPSLSIAGDAGATSGGWLKAPTKASANDYRGLATPPLFELLAGKPLTASARIRVAESGANTSSWYFGLVDVLTAGFLQTTGAPPSSYNGAVLWKAAGSNLVHFEIARGTTKSRVLGVGTFVSGAATLLSLHFRPADPDAGTVLAGVGGPSGLQNPVGTPVRPQPIALAGLTPLFLSAGVVASTSAAETLQIDYWGVDADRP